MVNEEPGRYIMKDKMILYGVGLAGEKFFSLYRNKYQFIFAIDKHNNRFFHDMPVYSLEDAKEKIENNYIAIATETRNTYLEIARLLEELGLIEFDDFRWAKTFDKELAILYGNCHMSRMEAYLSDNIEFDRNFEIRRYDVSRVKIDGAPSESELRHCKVLIAQDIRSDNQLMCPAAEDLIGKISENCQKVIIPNLYGCNLFYPQAKVYYYPGLNVHVNKNAIDADITLEKNSYIKTAAVWTIGYRDENIENMYRLGKSIDEIADAIKNEEIYKKEDIIENFNDEMKKLKEREKHCDIKISDYIEENYQHKQMFYEPIHPTNDVVEEKARRVLSILNIKLNERPHTNRGGLDIGELFIYGCVRRALGIEFEQEYIHKYSGALTLYNKAINLKEYIEQYIAWGFMDE
jgi:hypothetical protein